MIYLEISDANDAIREKVAESAKRGQMLDLWLIMQMLRLRNPQ